MSSSEYFWFGGAPQSVASQWSKVHVRRDAGVPRHAGFGGPPLHVLLPRDGAAAPRHALLGRVAAHSAFVGHLDAVADLGLGAARVVDRLPVRHAAAARLARGAAGQVQEDERRKPLRSEQDQVRLLRLLQEQRRGR